jgi:hypothetical protein
MSGAERMRLMRQRDRQVIADMADAIEKLILLVPVRAGRAESLSSPDLDFIEAALAAGRKKLSGGTGPSDPGG